MSLIKILSFVFIIIITIVLVTCAIWLPSSMEKSLIFIEDALWSISWLVIARSSFLSFRAGFPPRAMPITLAVELYLMVHYTVIQPWPFESWLLLNYLLWPVASFFNLLALSLYSRDEFFPGSSVRNYGLRISLETIGLFLLFGLIARKLPAYLVMAYLGQTVIFIISLSFLVRFWRNQNLLGMSLVGNLLRIAAGILCYFVNVFYRGQELSPHIYLQFLMPLTVIVDLVFLILYVRALRRTS